ncbi:DNA cytosine methyltransferase [Thiothrix subterranea]|uniref:DNA cytosine methyltransferase n=1 Tax=Thiothrix subterranea TaxID=2735563 RepID=UPI0035ABB58F
MASSVRSNKRLASAYRRLDPTKPSPTVTRSGYRDFIHPYEDRMLTVRELACLQTFPLHWEFIGTRLDSYSSKRIVTMTQFGQVGNAVPPCLPRRLVLRSRHKFLRKT